MKHTYKGSVIACAVAAALAAPAVYATNGYFKIGYGSKSRGMAGVSTAYAQDAMAGVTNPANMALVGNRVDVGMELFNPRRDARLDATGMTADGVNAAGADSGKVESGATLFAIPHAGFVMNMAGGMSMGLTIAANGGMNTRYNSNVYFNSLGPAISAFASALAAGPYSGSASDVAAINAVAAGLGTDPDTTTQTLGVNLAQLIIAPSVAWKLNENHSVGASLQIGYQRFRAYGIGLFKGFSSNQNKVTNNGDDDAWGAGLRVGWTGQITDSLTLGASAASKIYMQKFDTYKGLFAEQGDFDVPANLSLGIAFKATPKTTLAIDVQRIFYGDVAAIANPGPTADEFMDGFMAVLTSNTSNPIRSVAKPLGTDNGWGFGWDDITVVKIGIEHQYNEKWTFRGGVNLGQNPIDDKENLFNILAPGVVRNHLTLGFTYSPTPSSELTMGYMHAFRVDQSFNYQTSTAWSAATGFPQQQYLTEIGMDQNSLEFSYAMKF
ncbi:outer membrane protein transport protein [Thiohalobacter sp. IOR34]|uniref:OmpP1/FadL family transporter n=1 Tax=Thiohalobacter sp. IOR34 TaxID=3057176 RepID=UPI0025B0B305|nr:outer membrane protein transport protein [Thiohalobacter sp. IOR34]WJW76192.1 outer membrane protein transport protein [Thiohalobacter sp. IOR34]